MNRRFSLGLIGCGLRGTGYISYLRKLGVNFELAAMADIDEANLKCANRDFAHNKATMFKSGEDLIAAADVEAVVIATPNTFHRGPAIATMKKGVPFLLEKPIATTYEDLAAIWQAYIKHNGKTVIGFSLRYAPFYQEIKKIVSKGVLGQILSINAEEIMSDRLSMIFCRSQWRPDVKLAGSLLLEKCCHDIDLLNWLTNSRAAKISSYANRSFLLPGQGPERTCDKCSEEDTCRFSQRRTLESFEVNISETQTDTNSLYSQLIDNKCTYHKGTPYPDHQSVMIEYENGILCTFNVIQVQPANRRTIHILGSEARLYGVIDDNHFTVFHRKGPNDEEPEVVRISTDDSGHNGADGPLTADLLNLMEGRENPNRPGLREGIESALMCLVADESAETGHSMSMAPARNRVFTCGEGTTKRAGPAQSY